MNHALVFSAVLALAAGEARAQTSGCNTDNLLAGQAPASKQDVQGNAALVTDGAVGNEGTQWDAPVAVTLAAQGWLTYDLGEARPVGALYVQADANDTYQVMGSTDGTSYTLLAQIPNVIDRGHGLRFRTVEVAPVTVRYLRIGDGSGDGFYSLSEFSAYCRAPTPFPPEFKTVAAPLAQVSDRVAPLDGRDGPSSGFFAFLAVATLCFLAGGFALSRRTSDSLWPRLSPDGALRAVFVASGAAALIYEIVWFHLLRLVIGASALSVAIVLASFMGGMFLGSLLFARFVRDERHPLRVYAFLEIGIGVCGLLMPLILPAVRLIYVGLFGYGALGIALRAVIAALLLLPPTALMGATLPAVARRFTSGRRGSSALASLYAANTIGAVIGSLLCAFYLLAEWDIWRATFAAVALNFLAGAYSLRLSRLTPRNVGVGGDIAAIGAERTTNLRVVYLAAALSGLTALGAQVVWTRLLTLLFGATIYAFAIILAVFLGGLGIGSTIAAYLLRRGVSAVRGLAFSQIALVPTLLLGAQLLAGVLPYASPTNATPVRALHALHVLRAIDIILPAAVLWGMSFPFALGAASAGHRDPGRSTGHVYAANTVGAIIGALLVSFWLIPAYGTRTAQQALVVAASVAAAALFYALRTPAAGPSRTIHAGWALAAGAVAAWLLPGLSQAFLAHGRYIWWVDARDKYPYVSEGAASTVAVHIAPSGYRNFHVSGRVEASNNPNDMRLERLLGHLSALAHPHPESVLVVGLGAGITAGALTLHPEVKRIVICEIEPRVVGAANQFAAENYAVLSDPRVQMVFDDARHFLATTRERFDVITSDPIHPWVRGNSVLFSREYYAIVKARLKPDGIATQWVPLYETNEAAIKIQMRTFMDAFPNGTVWNSAVSGRGYDVVLLGREQPLRVDLTAIQSRLTRAPRVAQSLQDVKIASVADLMATYGAAGSDMKAWLSDTPVNRDFSLKLEYISGLALNQKEADPIYAHMTAGRAYPEALFIGPADLQAEIRRRLASKK